MSVGTVIHEQAKEADRLEPKGVQSRWGFPTVAPRGCCAAGV